MHSASPWLVAPLGASAMLVFAVPSSPMAQPWSVVGGNTVSALTGMAVVHGMQALGFPELTAGLAVGAAIAVMLALRCLHPPGGATALMVAMGGIAEPGFAFYPMMVNSISVLQRQFQHQIGLLPNIFGHSLLSYM